MARVQLHASKALLSCRTAGKEEEARWLSGTYLLVHPASRHLGKARVRVKLLLELSPQSSSRATSKQWQVPQIASQPPRGGADPTPPVRASDNPSSRFGRTSDAESCPGATADPSSSPRAGTDADILSGASADASSSFGLQADPIGPAQQGTSISKHKAAATRPAAIDSSASSAAGAASDQLVETSHLIPSSRHSVDAVSHASGTALSGRTGEPQQTASVPQQLPRDTEQQTEPLKAFQRQVSRKTSCQMTHHRMQLVGGETLL